jgi:HNH endonuclease
MPPYATVMIEDSDGNEVSRYVHELVAETFIGPCPIGMAVIHRNMNTLDNSAKNLEYVTLEEYRLRVEHWESQKTTPWEYDSRLWEEIKGKGSIV